MTPPRLHAPADAAPVPVMSPQFLSRNSRTFKPSERARLASEMDDDDGEEDEDEADEQDDDDDDEDFTPSSAIKRRLSSAMADSERK